MPTKKNGKAGSRGRKEENTEVTKRRIADKHSRRRAGTETMTREYRTETEATNRRREQGRILKEGTAPKITKDNKGGNHLKEAAAEEKDNERKSEAIPKGQKAGKATTDEGGRGTKN